MAKDNKPESKQYNLKETESQLLRFTQQHSQAIFSGILSTIAMERLTYKVTDRTQFNLNADLTEMTLTELPEEPKGEAVKAAA